MDFQRIFKSFLVIGSVIFLCFVHTGVHGQWEKGVKINLGLGSVYSGNLNDYFSTQKKNDPFVTVYNSRSGSGGIVGIGGFLIYPINAKMSIYGDASLNYQFSKLFINYTRDSLYNNYTGPRHKITSDNNLKIISLNVPVLFRYLISEKRRLSLLGGFTMALATHPKLISNEMDVHTFYNNGIITSTNITKTEQKVGLNKASICHVYFTGGIEKRFKRSLKNLTISLTGNISLTNTKLQTSNSDFYNTALNNRALASQAQVMSNFRMASVLLSFRYKLSPKK